MNSTSANREFFVQNCVRAMIFMLLFALAFVAAVWLIPYPFHFLALLAVLLVLPAIHYSSQLNVAVQEQVFDRIKLRKFGVEYIRGILG